MFNTIKNFVAKYSVKGFKLLKKYIRNYIAGSSDTKQRHQRWAVVGVSAVIAVAVIGYFIFSMLSSIAMFVANHLIFVLVVLFAFGYYEYEKRQKVND